MFISYFTVSDLLTENTQRQARGSIRPIEFPLVLTSIFRLKRLRLALGMRRRHGEGEFEAYNSVMRQAIISHLQSGETTLYRRGYTDQRLRQSGIPVARDRMFSIIKELDSNSVANRRLFLSSSPHDGYFVPGPNFVWSLDGHHKLSMYGIEIYAGIDAYSRYVYIFSSIHLLLFSLLVTP